MIVFDSIECFSSCVVDYVCYWFDYLFVLLDWLYGLMGVSYQVGVVDIGVGIGIFSCLFFVSGYLLVVVEFNVVMCVVVEQWLVLQYLDFFVVDGCVEVIGLEDVSIDLVSVVQVFYWFDIVVVCVEWQCILCFGGQVLIYWNLCLFDVSLFLIGYEQLLLDYGIDYIVVVECYQDDVIMQVWFGFGLCGRVELLNVQYLDFDVLCGCLLFFFYVF